MATNLSLSFVGAYCKKEAKLAAPEEEPFEILSAMGLVFTGADKVRKFYPEHWRQCPYHRKSNYEPKPT